MPIFVWIHLYMIKLKENLNKQNDGGQNRLHGTRNWHLTVLKPLLSEKKRKFWNVSKMGTNQFELNWRFWKRRKKKEDGINVQIGQLKFRMQSLILKKKKYLKALF